LLIGHFMAILLESRRCSIHPSSAPDQLPIGAVQFILSLRATGEGHISSITFDQCHPSRSSDQVHSTALTEPTHANPGTRYTKRPVCTESLEVRLGNDFPLLVVHKIRAAFTWMSFHQC
jgi:hypothetical protein